MAEQQSSYEFTAVSSRDILAERQRGWESFTRFTTWSVAATVLLLVLLAVFVA